MTRELICDLNKIRSNLAKITEQVSDLIAALFEYEIVYPTEKKAKKKENK